MLRLKKLPGIKLIRSGEGDNHGVGQSLWKRTGARLQKHSKSPTSLDDASIDWDDWSVNVQAEEIFGKYDSDLGPNQADNQHIEDSTMSPNANPRDDADALLSNSLQTLARNLLHLATAMQTQTAEHASNMDALNQVALPKHIGEVTEAATINTIMNVNDKLQLELRESGLDDEASRLADMVRSLVTNATTLRPPPPALLHLLAQECSRSALPTQQIDAINCWMTSEASRLSSDQSLPRKASSASSYKSAQEGIETNPFRAAKQEQDAWAAKSEPTDEGTAHLQAGDVTNGVFVGSHPEINPYNKGKIRELPSISDIDWSQIPESEVQFLINLYSKPISLTDSGIGFGDESPINESMKWKGKGKQRVAEVDNTVSIELPARRASAQAENERIERLQRMLHALKEQDARLAGEIALMEQENEAARLAEEAASRLRDCVVCGDGKDPLDYPAEVITSGCEHQSKTCKSCLESWMASEFETKGTDGIKCPECTSTLTYDEFQRAASETTFAAYDKMCTRNALSLLPEFAWCLSAACGSGQLNIENANFMDCMSCGYKQCLRHRMPWHVGEKCEEYDYRTSGQKEKDEEAQTQAMLNTVSKLCPGKNCGWRIEKSVGCDHMTCRKCKHEFCWQCLAPQKEIKRVGNTAHAATCKFHSHNLDVAWPFNMH